MIIPVCILVSGFFALVSDHLKVFFCRESSEVWKQFFVTKVSRHQAFIDSAVIYVSLAEHLCFASIPVSFFPVCCTCT